MRAKDLFKKYPDFWKEVEAGVRVQLTIHANQIPLRLRRLIAHNAAFCATLALHERKQTKP